MSKTFAIGLMSGTSLDGLDICYAAFEKNFGWNFEILKAETIAYNEEWRKRLSESMKLSAQDLFAFNSDFGFFLGEKVQDFISKNHIKNIDVIASHGQTVFHQPSRKFTTQIGDGRAIKILTKIPTVYDFRNQDVLLGGNGAPLVPIGDELLFSDFDACINLGGFSNISFKINNKRIAFDICPVNFVLNKFAAELGFDYDKNGDIARNSNIDFDLLKKLNSLDFYQKPFPKSLGAEWVFENIFPLLKNKNPHEILANYTAHAAHQIASVLNHFKIKNALVTGGGAHNQFLIESLKKLTKTEIAIPKNEIVNFKEALIFAFMGVLRLRNETNVLASATGAAHDHCTGILV